MKTKHFLSLLFSLLIFISCKDNVTPPPANPNPNYTEERPPVEFIHPGILHTEASLTRMKNFVNGNVSPAIDCYKLMEENPKASANYQIQGPFAIIGRLGAYKDTKIPSEEDHMAAYLNSLMWYITGDEAHALKAIEILNAYANTLKEIDPNDNDEPLSASLQGFILANACEIIKYTYDNVSQDDIKSWENMFRNVFIPVLRKFFSKPAYTNGNWGTAAIKAFMAFGVFLDDDELYNYAIEFFYNGNDNGCLTKYIGETGQCQESGRDQNHTMLGLGHLAEACEIAYNQNNETLYSASENRLMAGYEYTAKYNLGEDVPFTQWIDVTGRYSDWTVISETDRGNFRPIFEIAYNHYVTRKGLEMPYTQQVIAQISPEGPVAASACCDNPGYGTLLFRTETGKAPTVGIIDIKANEWETITSGATGVVSGNDFIVTPNNGGSSYRGDIQVKGTSNIHAGNYPIIAIMIDGLPESASNYALTFDSPELGTFTPKSSTDGRNRHKTISTDSGTVYYWDFSDETYHFDGFEADTDIPKDASLEFTIKLKIADIKNVGDASPYTFTVKWMKSFEDLNALNEYIGEN